jgi:DNA-binding FadR family transcriptional regulator
MLVLDKRRYERYNRLNMINLMIGRNGRERPMFEVSEFLRYLAAHTAAEGSLPPLTDLSRELGISVAGLREQLEVARALGLVDVRPRIGTRRLPFSFTPAVGQALAYALALSNEYFQPFSDLRNHLEAAYWDEATGKLLPEDREQLRDLVASARAKLAGVPLQVPHEEHRRLHLLIYSRLKNPFVTGLLEAYWEMYEAVGLNVYSGDIEYLDEVWDYHGLMVEGICTGDFDAGRRALLKHVDLLAQRPRPKHELE